jgi:hypothetical protein
LSIESILVELSGVIALCACNQSMTHDVLLESSVNCGDPSGVVAKYGPVDRKPENCPLNQISFSVSEKTRPGRSRQVFQTPIFTCKSCLVLRDRSCVVLSSGCRLSFPEVLSLIRTSYASRQNLASRTKPFKTFITRHLTACINFKAIVSVLLADISRNLA